MGKKAKIKNLTPKAEKVSKEHLEQLQGIVNKINTIQFSIGRMESQKHTALHDLHVANDSIVLMQQTLIKEYGSYDVDLRDGTINWSNEKKDEK
tara:strand:- start:93 stop:374 length:282 start_codon:yes stop_codon:yes gene_type:complete